MPPKSRSKTDLCSVCRKKVSDNDLAVCCDPVASTSGQETSETTTHWTHASCLEAKHLLNGSVVVPLSRALFEKIDELEFSFSCHKCSKGESKPLPFQLVSQGILNFQDFAALDILTPELESFLVGRKSQKTETESKASTLENQLGLDDTFANGTIETSVKQPFLSVPVISSPSQGAVASAEPSGGNFTQNMFAFMQQQQVMLQKQQESQQQFMAQQMERQFERLVSVLDRKTDEYASDLRAERERSQANLVQERQNFTASLNQDRQTTSLAGGSSVSAPKLPKIKIPVFTGNVLEWPSFWNMFTEMVDKHDQYSDIEKMNFLLMHLGESVKLIVKNFSLESQNYRNVLDLLKDRFENKSKIQAAHFQALMTIPSVANLNLESLQRFSDTAELHHWPIINPI